MLPNLVYVSARDGKYASNLLREPRSFDVAVNNWSNGLPSASPGSDYAFTLDREKLHGAFDLLADIVPAYDAVAFLDDDLEIDSESIDRLFAVGAALGLNLWQPALAPGSACGWAHTRQQAGSFVRPVPMVEIMCPFFSGQALAKCWHTFGENESGWGLDWVWPIILDHQSIAIVDAIAVGHFRPITSHQRTMRNGLTPRQEAAAIIEKYRGTHADTMRERILGSPCIAQ